MRKIYNKKSLLYISFTLIGLITLLFLNFYLFDDHGGGSESINKQTVDNMNKPRAEIIEEIIEKRSIETQVEERYVIDREKLALKTDEDGIIEVTNIITHSTQQNEKVILYALLEQDSNPILIDLNGTLSPFHIIDVPKEGKVESKLTLKGLPEGSHIIYFVTEKQFENGKTNTLEIQQDQNAIMKNYFSLVVNNSDIKKSENSDTLYKFIEKKDVSDEGPLSLILYEDSSLSSESLSINKKDYFLLITNTRPYELKAHIKLLNDYTAENIEKVLIPGKSQVILPVNLKQINAKNSIRFVLVGEPVEEMNAPYPIREVEFSKRIFINNN